MQKQQRHDDQAECGNGIVSQPRCSILWGWSYNDIFFLYYNLNQNRICRWQMKKRKYYLRNCRDKNPFFKMCQCRHLISLFYKQYGGMKSSWLTAALPDTCCSCDLCSQCCWWWWWTGRDHSAALRLLYITNWQASLKECAEGLCMELLWCCANAEPTAAFSNEALSDRLIRGKYYTHTVHLPAPVCRKKWIPFVCFMVTTDHILRFISYRRGIISLCH